MKKNLVILLLCILGLFYSCNTSIKSKEQKDTYYPSNILDYSANPTSPDYRDALVFFDKGAWFGYSFTNENQLGFAGPFLLTQEQGIWSSKNLYQLKLFEANTKVEYCIKDFDISKNSYLSHLEQSFKNHSLEISQYLYYISPHTAFILTEITNVTNEIISISPTIQGELLSPNLKIRDIRSEIEISSKKSNAKGLIKCHNIHKTNIIDSENAYLFQLNNIELMPNETAEILISQTFTFPEQNIDKEIANIETLSSNPKTVLSDLISEKKSILLPLYEILDEHWQNKTYRNLLIKTLLTLQNNHRIAAEGLKHNGIFPSYHYIWFHGFWAWDSWKHSVALAFYDLNLAKDQIRATYDFQLKNGFIPDCIYRDTSLEQNNYRNTKPPLSAWAVWKVFEQENDISFLKEMYPKIVNQHNWWYKYRDYDNDSICEYGSTDGSLIAAKWESGMDNAVRFDKSKILKSDNESYSLDQESVDLNAYLYAEKIYLSKMANLLNLENDAFTYIEESKILKTKIQKQFYDTISGWFYDTSIDGKEFILVMGCEGWIPLWANVATKSQAESVKNNMMNPDYFFTAVPFQTLSASNSNFNPNRGYWRGPNWLDQAYFGVKGLHNYNYHEDAYEATYKLFHNAEGLLDKGQSIRENYQPITGEGMESENFSWSAAHYLLLLLNQ